MHINITILLKMATRCLKDDCANVYQAKYEIGYTAKRQD